MTSTDGTVYISNDECSVVDATSSSAQNGNGIIPGPYYKMSGDKYLIIFNHYKYQHTRYFRKTPLTRNGTFEDVKTLRHVFEDLKFQVQVYQDLEHGEIISIIGEFTHRHHADTSCVIVAIMTHGDSGGELTASDRPYKFTDVLNPFYSRDSKLAGVPKLFFVQACRGDKKDDGIAYDGDRRLIIPTHADLLILYATFEDYVSWRAADGSFLMQELCKFIKRYGKQLDILQIITFVNNSIAFTKESYNPNVVDYHRKKQMPETRFTLTKFLRLYTGD